MKQWEAVGSKEDMGHTRFPGLWVSLRLFKFKGREGEREGEGATRRV